MKDDNQEKLFITEKITHFVHQSPFNAHSNPTAIIQCTITAHFNNCIATVIGGWVPGIHVCPWLPLEASQPAHQLSNTPIAKNPLNPAMSTDARHLHVGTHHTDKQWKQGREGLRAKPYWTCDLSDTMSMCL